MVRDRGLQLATGEAGVGREARRGAGHGEGRDKGRGRGRGEGAGARGRLPVSRPPSEGSVPTWRLLPGSWGKANLPRSRSQGDSRQFPQGLDGEGAHVAVGEAGVQQLQGTQDWQLRPRAQQVEHLGELVVRARGGLA